MKKENKKFIDDLWRKRPHTDRFYENFLKCEHCGKYTIYCGTTSTSDVCDCDKRERERLEKLKDNQ